MDASSFGRWLAAAARFVLPPRCMACGDAGADGIELCDGCLRTLPFNASRCACCALPLPRDVARCGACVTSPPPWDGIWVPFRYEAPLARLEARFKFNGSLAAGRTLSQCWLRADAPHDLPQAIVPVPLHVTRLRARGFNQALELVRPVARRLGVRLCADALKRVRTTEAQSELDAPERARNVRGAFAVHRWPSVDHVAVVDDVMTTGATLGECVRALRSAGVSRVDVWAMARTGLGHV